MRRLRHLGNFSATLAVFFCLFLFGCSHFPGNVSGTGTGGGSAPLTLTFHDSPPAGIAVTSFEVTVTGAVLQPGNISLLSTPQTIELTQLQANSLFLSTNSVAANTYTSLTLTYSNPQYTIYNDTGASITATGTTCAVNQSCVITPTESGATTFTLSSSPFPLTVAASQPTLLEMDVNLNDIIQSDYSVNFTDSGAVTATQLTSTEATSPIDSLFVSGQVASVGQSTFNLTTPAGQTLSIPVNSSTVYAFQGDNCTANDFTCISVGQILYANVSILGNGTFTANEVDYDDASSTDQVSGTIISLGTASPPTSFQMVVHGVIPASVNLATGVPVNVTIQNTATYVVNSGSVTYTGTASFASATDLLVGQEVEARVSGTVTQGSPASFTANRLALEQSQLTASVTSVNAGTSNFYVNTLPPLFSSAPVNPVTQILIDTFSNTQYQQLPSDSFSDINTGVVVSVGGFLFNTAGFPTVGAVTVRGQVPGT